MSFEEHELNRRVLVIDDNTAIHEDFRKILAPPKPDADLDDDEQALFGGDDADYADLDDEPFSSTPRAPAAMHYELDCASQGREGYERICAAREASMPYALAFIDMRMPPGWDGLETIRRIREVDSDVQMVICTAYSDYSWEALADELGATDQVLILKKPFDNAEVRQIAAAMTEKWNLARRANYKLDQLERMVHDRTLELEASNRQLRQEVEQRESVETRLRFHACHDALTQLPNRATLQDHLEACRRQAARESGCHFAVLFLDVDDFKRINDSFGHDAGDELLQQLASRLVSATRKLASPSSSGSAMTARLGGDEFVVLLENIRNINEAEQVASDLQDKMRQPFIVAGQEIHVSSSIGIAACDGPERAQDDLLRNADIAMYHAKSLGKNRCVVFDPAMHARIRERMSLESELNRALSRDEIETVYQPILGVDCATPVAVEALMRWRHAQRGVMLPDEFLAIAEQTRLINGIGRCVLDQAVDNVVSWRALPGMASLRAAVNVSRVQLVETSFAESVKQALGRSGLPAEALILEVTESTLLEGDRGGIAALEQCRAMGVLIALDDFGAGMSSISGLHRLPIDIVKIDRTFAAAAVGDRQYAAVVQAIVVLAHNLGLKVTVEGVDVPERVSQFVDLECDYCQGYHFARPAPAAEIPDILRKLGSSSRAA